MFLKSLASNLILAVLGVALVLWAAPKAGATIIVCQSQISVETGLADDMATWVGDDPLAAAGEMALGGMTGLPLQPTDEEREHEAQKDRLLRALHGSLMNAPGDMSPSSNSLLQLTGSSAGGFATPSDMVAPPQAELQASLPPEERMILPTGPPNRRFRPPRA